MFSSRLIGILIRDCCRKANIFRHREDLLAFEEAGAVENTIADILERKDYVDGGEACDAACEEAKTKVGIKTFCHCNQQVVHYIFHQFALALEDAYLTEHVRSLPRFLRKFTVGSVLAYALTKCVDLLEKRRKYEEATALLRTLLAQAGFQWICECLPIFDDNDKLPLTERFM